MKAIRIFLLVPLLILGACAQTPSTDGRQGSDSQVLDSANSRSQVHTELAAQYYARRQYSVALQEVQEALKADINYAPAYNMLGLLHAALLEDKEAEENFRHALSLAPQYSEAHNNYGYFLCSRKRYDDALSQFEQAWKNPLYATPEKALANAGQCALRIGKLDEAENYSRRALIRVPNQPLALMTMADIQFRRGNLPMARSMLGQADSQGGLDASGLWLGVRLERRAGNREAEAEYASRLRRLYPESQETGWLLSGQFDMQEGR